MRRLNVDREDNPAPGIRTLGPQDQSAKSALVNHAVARKGREIVKICKKVLAKHHTIRQHHPLSRLRVENRMRQLVAQNARAALP